MSTEKTSRLNGFQAAAAIVFLAGPIAWLWTGEWKWAVTAVATSLAIVFADAAVTSIDKR